MNRRHQEQLAKERRRKRMVFVFSLFIVLTMIGGIFAAMLYNPATQDRMEYGDHELYVKELAGGGSVYALKVDGNEVELQHLPALVTYFEVDPGVAPLLAGAQQVALVADVNTSTEEFPLVDYARFQLAVGLSVPSFTAMTGANAYNQPIINCSMASPQMPVLLFISTNGTPSITRDGSCVLVQGSGRGLLAAKDRLLYERMGVIVDGQVIED